MATPPAATASSPPAGPLGKASIADLHKSRVAVFSIPACPYCKRAKEALTIAGIPYVDVNVGHDDALRQLVRDVTGKRTVPQVGDGRSGADCLT